LPQRGRTILGTDPTDLIGADPLLGPLGDYGGPTRTDALLPGSPAIDAVPAAGAACLACDSGAFEVRAGGSAIALAPITLPDGTPGLAYTATFTASGGTGTGCSFAVAAGMPAPGLMMSGAGPLSGAPTTKGTYRFTVRATDSGGQVGEREYGVMIGPAIPQPVRRPG
jgi:hypothetical protein